MAEPNFAVTRMRIAIDTSGSTAGGTLDAEIRAVKEISTTIKSQKEPLLVMPWNSRASAPISPKECKNLGSTGGTNTSSLYGNPDCLKALQNCGLWFLFTDGQISKAEVENFALNTATYGLHGTPNVVTIFGRAADTLPGLVDFSVGIITYSAAPDSLLLFHDVSTGTVFLLQAKGCFKALLPAGSTQPELTSTLAWHQLPSISYKDLASLRTPKPKKLAADKLALADGLVIRLKDLYSGTASAEVLERVSEPENLRSLTIHQSSAGRADEFQNFLEQQQQQVPHAPRERVDIDGKAQEAIITLLNAVKNGASDKILEVYREKLRVAHGENWKIFRSSEEQDREVARESRCGFKLRWKFLWTFHRSWVRGSLPRGLWAMSARLLDQPCSALRMKLLLWRRAGYLDLFVFVIKRTLSLWDLA